MDVLALLIGVPCLLWLLAALVMVVSSRSPLAELRRRHQRAMFVLRESERRQDDDRPGQE
ncbi:hypothetical protein O7600_20125 [Micromonospora sp. WMMA1998]|uniref:hypothetical protein n=1 Tax=Micromonospora sp. WMMA1998 TaxID=3015167 RepID=UPI00248B8378|nr:hypothetical protein [Micromonospora sp. WMMA1998]WBC13439.1 hypothetical protein O7600_20125 [Micromonospora sp. WMMA1998]